MNDDLLILFPGALGDFICFRPTLLALRARTRGRVTIAAQPAFSTLLAADEFTHLSIHRSEIADLFASGPLASATLELFAGYVRTLSWTGHGNPTFAVRLASATGGQVAVHPFRAMKPGEHAMDYYARCVNVQPVSATFQPGPEAQDWARSFWKRHALSDQTLAAHPGSGSTTKNWLGMPSVVAWWQEAQKGTVLTLAGPAEAERGLDCVADAQARNEPLDRAAALLKRSLVYLGNDSGISHLAALVGTPSVVLFGPTDPSAWSPRGPVVRVIQAVQPCRSCGAAVFCTHRLPVPLVCQATTGAAGNRAATRSLPGCRATQPA